MRLALLSPLPPDPSRVAQHAAQFRRALNLADIDVLTPLVGQRPLENLAQAKAWVAERDWRGVDVVHAEFAPGQRTIYWVMQALARLPQGPALTATLHAAPDLLGQPIHAPFAAVYHADWLPGSVRRVAAWLAAPLTRATDRRLARRLAGVICASDDAAKKLARRLRLPAERITVMPPCLSSTGRQVMPPQPLKLLCLSAPGQSPKPLQELAAALATVQAAEGLILPPWQVTFAGATAASCLVPPRKDPLTSLQESATLADVADRVTWHLDPDAEDLPALMAAHHVLLLPQRDQAWGLDGTEPGATSPQAARALAWAAGRPILTVAAGAEAVRAGNGAAYSHGDTAGLTALLQELITSTERLTLWSQQAQRLAEGFSGAALAARYVGFFQQAVCFAGRANAK